MTRLTSAMAWTAAAACQGRTDLFFPPRSERPDRRIPREAQARRLCRACPVLGPCREWARLQGEYGFWGGESEEERALAGYPVELPVGRVARIMTSQRAAGRNRQPTVSVPSMPAARCPGWSQ